MYASTSGWKDINGVDNYILPRCIPVLYLELTAIAVCVYFYFNLRMVWRFDPHKLLIKRYFIHHQIAEQIIPFFRSFLLPDNNCCNYMYQ